MGNLLALKVTAANEQEREQVAELAARVLDVLVLFRCQVCLILYPFQFLRGFRADGERLTIQVTQ